jgi:hypothetical protein
LSRSLAAECDGHGASSIVVFCTDTDGNPSQDGKINSHCCDGIGGVCSRLEEAVGAGSLEEYSTLAHRLTELRVSTRAGSNALLEGVKREVDRDGLGFDGRVAEHIIVESLTAQHLTDGHAVVVGAGERWRGRIRLRWWGIFCSRGIREAWGSLGDTSGLNNHAAFLARSDGGADFENRRGRNRADASRCRRSSCSDKDRRCDRSVDAGGVYGGGRPHKAITSDVLFHVSLVH